MSPQTQALENAILAEAQREARQVLTKAEQKEEQIRRDAQKALKDECETILNQAREQAEKLVDEAIATAQIEAQALKLKRREQLLASVFNAAQQQIPNIPTWSDYGEIVENLIREAMEHLPDHDVRLHADKATYSLLNTEKLSTLSTGLNIHLHKGNILPHSTGIIVETLDGHQRYDNTFENRLARARQALRPRIYHMLRGEQK